MITFTTYFIINVFLGIERSPYKAMFGIKMKMRLTSSIIPKKLLPKLQKFNQKKI